MKLHGFELNARDFLLRGVDATSVISFQKSDTPALSGADRFVINAGVSAKALSEIFGVPAGRHPSFGDTGIHFRIEPTEGWWVLPTSQLAIPPFSDRVFEMVFPHLKKLRVATSLYGLRDLLRSGELSAISGTLQDRYLKFLDAS